MKRVKNLPRSANTKSPHQTGEQREGGEGRKPKKHNPKQKAKVDHENKQIEAKEDVAIRQPVKASQKRKQPLLQSKGDGGVLVPLNGAQAEAVRFMGFAPFLKIDVKQIPGKFFKWLVERLPDGQKFPVIAFDVHATLGVPLGGTEIIEITESSMDDEYNEEWKLQKNASELTRMPEFILSPQKWGESFNRNFIIYLVNCFFSGPKNRYCNKSILKYLKDVSQIPSLDWCQFVVDKLITSVRHYKESTAAKAGHFDGLLFFLMVSSPIQQCIPWSNL
ncbi:hypothetical protein Cgig2_031615 [Carnegiea gigantea]|uniref:Uncharacterized protein n=1 Tax=Carnegiea gigantea TaxID=171969 RepID=A0A9Q1QAD7_9CARY|nr:hypothetical protein Cgig2_031615 [Carnegiea gigantea]